MKCKQLRMQKALRQLSVIVSVLFSVGLAGQLFAAVEVTTAFQIPNGVGFFGHRGCEAVATFPGTHVRGPGSMVYVYLQNDSEERLEVVDVHWDGVALSEHTKSYQAVWWRLSPQVVEVGEEAELAICLRDRLTKPTSFAIEFKGGERVETVVAEGMPEYTIETIAFSKDLDHAFLYVKKQCETAGLCERLFVDGRPGRVRWLSSDYVNAVRVGRVSFGRSLERGSWHVFRLAGEDGKMVTGAGVRAYSELAVFGTYGGGGIERYAINGLTAFNSFISEGPERIDLGKELGVRIASMVGPNPSPETFGHEGLYSYVLMDEPDGKDHRVDDRPLKKRAGAHAPRMVEYAQACRVDPSVPTMLTLYPTTLSPYIAYMYGPIADITNPDCYTLSMRLPLKAIREYLATIRQACRPRPFTFAYQGCWEEAAVDPGQWVSRDELNRIGWEAFRDHTWLRGYGRKPVPAEVRMSMLYAIGCGAHGLFNFTDASELSGRIMFHGSEDLPELWAEIGRTSRVLDQMADLIDVSYALDWARSDNNKLWVKTLWCGEDAALVVAVNEDYQSSPEDFSQAVAADAPFSFGDLPWLDAQAVYRVMDGRIVSLSAARDDGGLGWSDSIATGCLYLVVGDQRFGEEVSEKIAAEANGRARKIVGRRREAIRRAGEVQRVRNELIYGSREALVAGEPVNGYHVSDLGMWNPAGAKLNVVEFYESKGTTVQGVQWKVNVGADVCGLEHRFSWEGRFFGSSARLEVSDDGGQLVFSDELIDVGSRALRHVALRFPQAGAYTIRIVGAPPTAREHGGRIALAAYCRAIMDEGQ